MGYKILNKIRIDLSELGDNNGVPFFVEIKNPKMLTFGQKLEFAKVTKIDDSIEQAKASSETISSLIVAWNLIDMETEQPIDPKAKDALDHVPGEVLEKIFLELRPKQDDATKNSSVQSDKS